MPFFRYSATDRAGTTVDGTVEANTAEDALRELLGQGLTVQQIMKALGPAPLHVTRPEPKPQSVVQRAPAIPIPVPAAVIPAQPSVPKVDQIRTPRASDKDRLFLFSQLAQQLKAGIGPAEALNDLAFRISPVLRVSVQEASASVGQGKTISEALERYPDLYPDHVVGTIRAAEEGGFLPEACELIADQAQNAYSFLRWFWWIKPLLVNGLVALPLVWLLTRVILAAWGTVELQGEGATKGSTMAALVQAAIKLLIWPIGPLTLLLWIGSIGLWKFLASERVRKFRHETALKWPVFGNRTRHECLSVFTWVMSKVSKAGVSPNRSWELAASSVPNLAVRERLERVGTALNGSEKLSDVIFREKLFPAEYAPVVATAEHTGDYPGAFAQLSKVSQAEFEVAQGEARKKASAWGRAVGMAIGGAVLILIFYMVYRELLPSILSGLDD